MDISRRVDLAVEKLTGFIQTELNRHFEEPLIDYNVSLQIGEECGRPTVELEITNTNRPRVFSRGTFSLYHFPPIIKHHAKSRTIDVMERASSYLCDRGIPYTAIFPMDL